MGKEKRPDDNLIIEQILAQADKMIELSGSNDEIEVTLKVAARQIELEPNNPKHYEALANVFLATGRRDQAREIIEAALNLPIFKDSFEIYSRIPHG